MAKTKRRFNNMLNENLHYDLLMEELAKRNYFIQNVEKDEDWNDGPLPIPFWGAKASSMRMGSLTAESDISQGTTVRGYVDSQKEIWGSLAFDEGDVIDHEGYVKEKTFMKDLYKQTELFIDDMKDCVSTAFLSGPDFARLTADSNANDGIITVDRIERFQIDQKVTVKDSVNTVTAYVKQIDINAEQALLVTTRGGATVVDFSATPVLLANDGACYIEDADDPTKAFTSLRDQLLPAAQGGSANLFGINKLAYPHLQAVARSGASMSATNILEKIFDHWTLTNKLGKGHATDVVCSFKHLGNVMKQLESGSGPYRHISTKATVYGYTEIVVMGVKGQLKIVGVSEMPDDLMYFLDWRAIKLHSNGWFKKHVDPNGNAYHTIRAESGYTYICDVAFRGELAVHSACRCGVLYGIVYA